MGKAAKITPLIGDAIASFEARRRKSIFGKGSYFDWGIDKTHDVIFTRRIFLFRLTLLVVVAVLVGRLFHLTIIQGSKNRFLAENNRIRLVELTAPRGKILDRSGQILADSAIKYFLKNDNDERLINEDQALELETRGLAGENFTGELGRVVKINGRIYPFGDVLAQVIGYTSEVQGGDLGKNSDLESGEYVGRLGLEAAYENILRGVNGKKIIEVDARGQTISILDELKQTPGQDLTITIDLALQARANEILTKQIKKVDSKSGAVVISKVENGEILTLVSLPSFDPDNIGKFVTDEDKPLFNRAIAGTYPPGSIFKIVSALAGLESGKITKETKIEDVGEFYIGDTKFSNWYFTTYGGRDGVIAIDRAIARSNDIFFFRLGERVGLDAIRKVANKLGFGQATGIDLPGEAYGLVGDEVWKQATLASGWFLGDTLHLAIGQGFVLATPIQVNMMTAFMANGGKLVKPHLVRQVGKETVKINTSEVLADVIAPSNYAVVREGMRQACARGGTGWPFFTAAYQVGCKTGTAERTQGNPHAWFTAFAPHEVPEVAITVIIENGGEGSSVAAPVAREILDWWFSRR